MNSVNYLRILHCETCGKESDSSVHLVIDIEIKKFVEENRSKEVTFATAHDLTKTRKVSFIFCDSICLSKWLKKHKNNKGEKVILCPDCNGTGFMFGHEVNGVCKLCNGKKEIKW